VPIWFTFTRIARHLAPEFARQDFALALRARRIGRHRNVIARQLDDLLRDQVTAVGAVEPEDHRIAQGVFLRTAFVVDRQRRTRPTLGDDSQRRHTRRRIGGGGDGAGSTECFGNFRRERAVRIGRHHAQRPEVARKRQRIAQVETASRHGECQQDKKPAARQDRKGEVSAHAGSLADVGQAGKHRFSRQRC
jgi:hypothetical protein